MGSRGGSVGSVLKLRKSRVCLHNFILAAVVIIFKDKTACSLFCSLPVSFAAQGTGEQKHFVLITPWIRTLETWILFMPSCGSGHTYITVHK